MVPPPSAVMQPSMQTPAQSMLRRPAASAAVIACAASATSDSTVQHDIARRQVPHRIAPGRSDWNLRRGFQHEQSAMNAVAVPRNISGSRRLSCGRNGGTNHGHERNPDRSLSRARSSDDEIAVRRGRSASTMRLQPDPELERRPGQRRQGRDVRGRPSPWCWAPCSTGLNNTSVNQAGTDAAGADRADPAGQRRPRLRACVT